MTRIFFSVDVHGNTALWRKWISAMEIYKADVLMFCGDLTGKLMVPIVRGSDGLCSVSYRGLKRRFSEEDIEKVSRELEERGVYTITLSSEEVEALKSNYEAMLRAMNERILERMRSWLNLLTSRIDTRKVQVVVMPGNDDIFEVDEVIKEYEDNGIAYPLNNVVDVGGVEMISLDYVNPTPWSTPREADEGRIKGSVEKLIGKLEDPSKSIFNFHSPPYGTKLDLAPELDKNLRPVVVGGGVRYKHVGSKSVLEAIRRYKPLIGLHGHIHESGGVDYVDKVPVLNPGSEYESAILKAYIVEIDKKCVKNFWRVEG
jgi:Icc-related predicted phosphoesterase